MGKWKITGANKNGSKVEMDTVQFRGSHTERTVCDFQ